MIWITPSYIVDPTKTGVYKRGEARAPMKKQEEQEDGHTIHCE